jgi:hypothetical protein
MLLYCTISVRSDVEHCRLANNVLNMEQSHKYNSSIPEILTLMLKIPDLLILCWCYQADGMA